MGRSDEKYLVGHCSRKILNGLFSIEISYLLDDPRISFYPKYRVNRVAFERFLRALSRDTELALLAQNKQPAEAKHYRKFHAAFQGQYGEALAALTQNVRRKGHFAEGQESLPFFNLHYFSKGARDLKLLWRFVDAVRYRYFEFTPQNAGRPRGGHTLQGLQKRRLLRLAKKGATIKKLRYAAYPPPQDPNIWAKWAHDKESQEKRIRAFLSEKGLTPTRK